MKLKLATLAAASLLFSAAISTPALAQDTKGPANEISEQCHDIWGTGEKPNGGSCTSFFRADDAAATCKELKDFGLLELLGFESQGDCVSYLRSLD